MLTDRSICRGFSLAALVTAADVATKAAIVAWVEPDLREAERLVPLGAALQNLLLAQAMGYGARLTSAKAMRLP